MKILLDTNFILTCAKQKIDFASIAEQMIDEKIEWLIPRDVINELDKIKGNGRAIDLSKKILEDLAPQVIELKGKNPNIDMKIVHYITGKKIVLATLDKDLKRRIDNKILTIRGKKNLSLIG